MDITGNKATAYGFIAAAEKSGSETLSGFLSHYSRQPMYCMSCLKHKSLGSNDCTMRRRDFRLRICPRCILCWGIGCHFHLRTGCLSEIGKR